MDFSIKINAKRPYKEHDNLFISVESDRGRILNCAALRRLQQKTQVFPLERNAAVRSRLTHSLEVQQNGRFIAQSIIRELSRQSNQPQLLDSQHADALISLVEMACIMHDIGNPAFGHFGEAAINDWFNNYFSTHPRYSSAYKHSQHGEYNGKDFAPFLIRDLCQFEGNAQAIRIIKTLSNLNLTYCQTASILKYTRCGIEAKPSKAREKNYLKNKVGYYYSEQSFIDELCDKLNITQGNRHPIAYIMEAADDIAYCLADIEDAVEKGLLSVETVINLLKDEYIKQLHSFQIELHEDFLVKACQSAQKRAWTNPDNYATEFFIYLRVELIHPLVKHATTRFIDNIEAIYHGSFNAALLEDNSYQHAITNALKQVALKHVFCHGEVEELELQGYKITSGILNEYQRLLDLPEEQFKYILSFSRHYPIEVRLLKRIPGQFIGAYSKSVNQLTRAQSAQPIYEFYYRCRLIQDFISGMTDQLAYDTYRTLLVID
ncbi:dGTPase [Pseudoalteromonas luteoviolacea]|uniref:dGTPase n=1 Tax=Pseudoalteromonas luteoviolacea TaxID=43657 RepID=UPI001B37EEC7|nr:dGTPase [Pseudoalteromonas luteoviolacea]MBQ4810793.1 dGTPase [Pseudoalteromonas luteoviolacea]